MSQVLGAPDGATATALAATRVAERLFDHLVEADREGLKRLVDDAAKGLERALATGSGTPMNRLAGERELALWTKLGAALG